MRIGYFADGPWAHKAFEKINADPKFNIAFICPRYDKKDPVLEELSKQNDIDFLVSKNVNSKEFLEKIDSYKCDILVSMSFNQIFKNEIINLTPQKLINCHAGKLPFYRGRNVLNWVLINDELEFGITVHYVDRGIDTGDIIKQRTYEISDNDDYGTLLHRAYSGCAEVLYDSLKDIKNNKVKSIPQEMIHPVGMYYGMRKAGDEVINWNDTSRKIFNFIRAITSPGPCATTYLDGTEVKVIKVTEVKKSPVYIGIPGQVVGKNKQGLIVKTKDKILIITEYSSEVKIRVGDRFE